MADESLAPRPPAGDAARPAPAALNVDESELRSVYANFYRVYATPEEVVMDFGFNVDLGPRAGAPPVKLTNRVILNLYTAKKLLGWLYQAINRHENLFGNIEVDVNRRLKNPPPPQ
jgi:hypothetical protein